MEGGKIIVLLGVNGAGKTTLMRILAGLENQDSGQILFNNQNIEAKALRQVSTLVFKNSHVRHERLRQLSLRIKNSQST